MFLTNMLAVRSQQRIRPAGDMDKATAIHCAGRTRAPTSEYCVSLMSKRRTTYRLPDHVQAEESSSWRHG